YTYDDRFGTVHTTTDPNGRTFTTERDALGRVIEEKGPGDVLVRSFAYDWDNRPISSTETEVPGFGQPEIVRTRYLDGYDREREVVVRTVAGAVVESWKTYDSLGDVSEEALPFKLDAVRFVPRMEGLSNPINRHESDVLGRLVRSTLADGR